MLLGIFTVLINKKWEKYHFPKALIVVAYLFVKTITLYYSINYFIFKWFNMYKYYVIFVSYKIFNFIELIN